MYANLRSKLATLCAGCILSGLLASCAAVKDNSNPQAESNDADAVAALLAQGDESVSREALDDAQVHYALAVSASPGNTAALYKLASVHFEKGSLDIARGLLSRVVALDEDFAPAYELQGLIALRSDQLEESEALLVAAVDLDSYRWRSLNALGVIHDMKNRHSEAQAFFTRALQAGGQTALIENNLGYSFYLAGATRQAINHFSNATRIDSRYDKAWSNLALAFVRLGDYTQARFAFNKVVDKHLVANNLGYLAMLQGDYETANSELASAIQLAPNHYAMASENLSVVAQRQKRAEQKLARQPPSATQHSEEILTPIVAKVIDTQPAVMVIQPAAYRPDKAELPATPLNKVVSSEAPSSKSTQKAPVKSKAVKTNIDESNFMADSLAFLGYQLIPNSDSSMNSAITSFQVGNELEVTGKLDSQTRSSINNKMLARVHTLMSVLGYHVTEMNTAGHPSIMDVVQRFQMAQGLKSTGKINGATLQHLSLLADQEMNQ